MTVPPRGRHSGWWRPLRQLFAIITACGLLIAAIAVAASAAPGTTTVAAVLRPLDGVWLDATEGGHYWNVTTHGAAPLSSDWQLPSVRSAQLVPRSGAQETTAGAPLAKQESRNTADFVVATGPAARPAGTYTAEFHDGGPALRATTALLSFGTTACPAVAQAGTVTH